MKKILPLFVLLGFAHLSTTGQVDRWQQKVDYRMQIHLDVETHQITGKQTLFYFNNSPDTLDRIFYHLYLNAFQPGSMMDVRSRNLPDPDARVSDRISKLKPDEIGYLKVLSLKQDGMKVIHHTEGTILEVALPNPMAPHSVTVLEMDFAGQVPIQIRRTGRDNAEGISYSMAQWYPKLCEYDYQGWHADPYVAREFYGVWGNYDVQITLNQAYTVAATGILQNADEIGHGYTSAEVRHKRKDELTWHFIAQNVHDFVWAADQEYTHTHILTEDGTMLHFFYQENERNKDAWEAAPAILAQAWSYIIKRFGPYPYGSYSFIQGGDGGMEYPMATLITGAKRSIGSLVGVSVHELMHSWYQMMLATNESLYAWMDEGFTTFASTEVMNELRRTNSIPGNYTPMPFVDLYNGLRNLIKSGQEEPLSTHADHFSTNYAYGSGSYTKGAVFLKQLEYIVGEEVFNKALLRYYYDWRFKHPNAEDFLRVFEKEAKMELDWYLKYFIESTRVIEYLIDDIKAAEQQTLVTLKRLGPMPMPIDVEVTYKDGSVSRHTIPLRMMLGAKKMDLGQTFKVESDWPWTNPTYVLSLDSPIDKIKSVRLDPSLRLADFDLENNFRELEEN
ncbi:MAG: M1 family metallopeptidase [Saprospiraceae bacterium]|nr:M1 family metallopeptidase [Saprospiraceae bacterium]